MKHEILILKVIYKEYIVKKILIKSGKDPRIAMTADESLKHNVFGNNPGNLLFWSTSHRMLSTRNQKLEVGELNVDNVDFVNNNYDHFVLPGANSLAMYNIKNLERLTDAIEMLKIPMTVLSIGFQASLDMSKEELAPLDKAVSRFVRAVLQKGPSIGVRGEYTAEYIRSLGFSDVEVIGCPSTFRYGADLQVHKSMDHLSRHSKISFTAHNADKNFADTVIHSMSKYKDLTYIPQDMNTVKFMVKGGKMVFPNRKNALKMPFYPAHPVFVNNKALTFADITTWLDYIATRDFMFGDRIHGTVAALLAGTPAFLVPHDARTLELARYHKIPHEILPKGKIADAAELYDKADFTDFNTGQAERFQQFEKYLIKHGLDNSIADKKFQEEYDQQVMSAGLTGPIMSESAMHGLQKNDS